MQQDIKFTIGNIHNMRTLYFIIQILLQFTKHFASNNIHKADGIGSHTSHMNFLATLDLSLSERFKS